VGRGGSFCDAACGVGVRVCVSAGVLCVGGMLFVLPHGAVSADFLFSFSFASLPTVPLSS